MQQAFWDVLTEGFDTPAILSPGCISRLCAMCRGIQQVAQQAFWDVLAEGLDQRPPQWERLLTLLEEARSMLLELIPENAEEGKQLRADVLEKLNMVRLKSPPEIMKLSVPARHTCAMGLV